ncbi:HAD family hydrolase [Amedibacillus sp. YH-ame6]
MRKLYVSDLDGTLLTSQSNLSSKTISIINGLIEQGMHFTFATARSISSASKVVQGLHLNIPMVVYNGVFIIDPIHHTPIYSQFFSDVESKQLLDTLLSFAQYPFVYAYIDGVERVSYLPSKLHEGGHHYLLQREHDKRFRPVEHIEELYDGNIFYMTCIHERVFLQEVYDKICTYPFTNTIFQQELYREEYWLEMMPIQASKAYAIQALKEMGKYDQVITFGDAINDLPMFAISDACYAVENALPQLKEKATGVISNHNQDAVALWLQEHFD